MDGMLWPMLAVIAIAITLRALYLRNGFLLTELAVVLWKQMFPRRPQLDPHRTGAPLGHRCGACDSNPDAHANGVIGTPGEWR